MRGFTDGILFGLMLCFLVFVSVELADSLAVSEETADGDILSVDSARAFFGQTHFSITIDLDDGRVVICPIHSEQYGSLLYRLYQKRTPEMPLLREKVRVVVGRHSGLTMCRGLAARSETK